MSEAKNEASVLMPLLGWVVDINRRTPDGPYPIIAQTRNGWVKFDGRKAAQKCNVHFSEPSALSEILKNLERKKRRLERDICKIKERLS